MGWEIAAAVARAYATPSMAVASWESEWHASDSPRRLGLPPLLRQVGPQERSVPSSTIQRRVRRVTASTVELLDEPLCPVSRSSTPQFKTQRDIALVQAPQRASSAVLVHTPDLTPQFKTQRDTALVQAPQRVSSAVLVHTPDLSRAPPARAAPRPLLDTPFLSPLVQAPLAEAVPPSWMPPHLHQSTPPAARVAPLVQGSGRSRTQWDPSPTPTLLDPHGGEGQRVQRRRSLQAQPWYKSKDRTTGPEGPARPLITSLRPLVTLACPVIPHRAGVAMGMGGMANPPRSPEAVLQSAATQEFLDSCCSLMPAQQVVSLRTAPPARRKRKYPSYPFAYSQGRSSPGQHLQGVPPVSPPPDWRRADPVAAAGPFVEPNPVEVGSPRPTLLPTDLFPGSELTEEPTYPTGPLGSQQVPFSGTVGEMAHRLARGDAWIAPQAWRGGPHHMVAQNRASFRLPSRPLRQLQAFLRAGYANVRAMLPFSTVLKTAFVAWIRHIAERDCVDPNTPLCLYPDGLDRSRRLVRGSRRGQMSILATHWPRFPMGYNPRNIRNALWYGPAGPAWRKLVKCRRNPWLAQIVENGATYYASPHLVPDSQPLQAMPAGPLLPAEVSEAETVLHEFQDMGFAICKDPVCKEWDHLRKDRGLLQQYMMRIEQADPTHTPWRRFQQAFCLPKKGDKPNDPLNRLLRLILSFKGPWGNETARQGLQLWLRETYSHRGFRDLIRLVLPGCHIADVDATKFFHQVRTDWISTEASWLWVRGRRWRLDAMCMGPSLAPSIAQRLANIIDTEASLACPDGRFGSMIDDHYAMGDTFRDALRAICALLRTCIRLGLTLNPDKCHLLPHQIRAILQTIVDTQTMWCYTSALTCQSIREKCMSLITAIETGDLTTPREIASLLGSATSAMDSAWQMTLAMQGLRELLTRMLRGSQMDWNARFKLNPDNAFFALLDAKRLHEISHWTGRPLLPWIPTEVIMADGSPYARGAVWLTGPIAATQSSPVANEPSSVAFRLLFIKMENALWSQNQCEVDASMSAIVSFVEQRRWRWLTVAIITDSMVNAKYIRRGGSVFSLAHAVMRIQATLWLRFRVNVIPLWLHGKRLYLADGYSRTRLNRPVWRLDPAAIHCIQAEFGPLHVDAFATIDTRMTRLFIGPFPQPTKYQLGTDFFAMNLVASDLRNTALVGAPPRRRVEQLLNFLQAQRVRSFTLLLAAPELHPAIGRILKHITRAPIVIPHYATRYELIWEPRTGVLAHPLAPLGVFHCCFEPQWRAEQPLSWQSQLLVPTKMAKAAESMIRLSTYSNPGCVAKAVSCAWRLVLQLRRLSST